MSSPIPSTKPGTAVNTQKGEWGPNTHGKVLQKLATSLARGTRWPSQPDAERGWGQRQQSHDQPSPRSQREMSAGGGPGSPWSLSGGTSVQDTGLTWARKGWRGRDRRSGPPRSILRGGGVERGVKERVFPESRFGSPIWLGFLWWLVQRLKCHRTT